MQIEMRLQVFVASIVAFDLISLTNQLTLFRWIMMRFQSDFKVQFDFNWFESFRC